jgi:hypothetical protein
MNTSAVIVLVPSVAYCTAVVRGFLCADSTEAVSLGASRTPKEASLCHIVYDALCLVCGKVKQSTLATLGVNLIHECVKGNLNKSLLHIIWMSVEVERLAVAHIVQLAVSAFPIVDAIEEVIDLFDVSFEEVSIVFAEGLVTDFEVLFHRLYIAFLFMFRQLLFFSCCHTIDADDKTHDGKNKDDFYLVHLVIAS